MAAAAPQPATGPTELPSDWKFGQAVPTSVWKLGDDPNKNPNNPIITHMVKVRDAMTKRGYGDTQSVQDKISRATRGQAFDPSGFQAWVDESENFEENFIGMAPQAVAEGLHPMIIADVEKLATLNPSDRYSAYSNIRGYFKGDPELSKMAADLMGGYYEADMLRGKYKTAEAKAKYAELEPMNQAFIKRALGQEQTVAEGQEDLDAILRIVRK